MTDKKLIEALEQIKTLCDQRYFSCEGPEHNDFYVLDRTLQNIEEIVKKTLKKDIPWPDPLDRGEIKDSKEKCDQKFKDGIRYFQG